MFCSGDKITAYNLFFFVHRQTKESTPRDDKSALGFARRSTVVARSPVIRLFLYSKRRKNAFGLK